MSEEFVPDDRVMLPARITAIAIIPVLSAAFVILYLFPTHTQALWAWTIHPTMTALLMGGGYLSGAYFFLRVATIKEWHRVGLGFLGVTFFATLLEIGTIVHWDRFNHDHVSFWAWLFLYSTTPFLLPWLWAVNRRQDPHVLAPGDRIVPTPIRVVMAITGAGQLVIAALLFFRPTAVIPHWPWTLTPLTARSLSAYVAFPAVAYLAFAFEKRWSAFQILVEVALIGMAFIGIGAIRAHAEFHGGDFLVWGWRIGLVVAFLLLLTLRLVMARPPRGAVLGLPGTDGGELARPPVEAADEPGQ